MCRYKEAQETFRDIYCECQVVSKLITGSGGRNFSLLQILKYFCWTENLEINFGWLNKKLHARKIFLVVAPSLSIHLYFSLLECGQTSGIQMERIYAYYWSPSQNIFYVKGTGFSSDFLIYLDTGLSTGSWNLMQVHKTFFFCIIKQKLEKPGRFSTMELEFLINLYCNIC